jgi:hypothetical protein
MKAKSSILFGLGATCLAALAIGAPNARAQIVTIDENGTLFPGAGPGTLVPDPTVPNGPPTVGYFLGIPTVPGDVQIFEPPGPAVNPPSDLLRFLPSPNGTLLLIYSDVSTTDPGNAPADVGLPPNLQTNVFQTLETGLGGAPYTDNSNGLVYTPAGGQPGQSVGTVGIQYNFISDSVPEPGMLCLTPAVAGLLMRNRRRSNPA